MHHYILHEIISFIVIFYYTFAAYRHFFENGSKIYLYLYLKFCQKTYKSSQMTCYTEL